ncbi:hypothetical protein AcW1_009216 [Taiwanofungus camphoratus]|nr:hypothetical protein AcV5_007238 [Antrodia cinnamomea]KAI0949681.1 hypothetical protein AcW1_009216 [Antrodia cinnamomea]KAI0958507.1 hypothetical protein AcV7_004311 [Antrodia cinnamomea]
MGNRRAITISDSDEQEERVPSDSEHSKRAQKQSRRAKAPRRKRPNSEDDDDERDEEDEEEDNHTSKRKRMSKAKDTSSKAGEDMQSTSVKVNSEGEKYVDLGKKRRATVRSFKGMSWICSLLYSKSPVWTILLRYNFP